MFFFNTVNMINLRLSMTDKVLFELNPFKPLSDQDHISKSQWHQTCKIESCKSWQFLMQSRYNFVWLLNAWTRFFR